MSLQRRKYKVCDLPPIPRDRVLRTLSLHKKRKKRKERKENIRAERVRATRRTNPLTPPPATLGCRRTLPPSRPLPCTDTRGGLRHLPREPLFVPQLLPLIAASTA